MPKRTVARRSRKPVSPAAATGPARREDDLEPSRSGRSDGLRVAVAAGPPLFREVLCRALAGEPGFKVVGQASAEEDIGAMLVGNRPEVLLFDYEALGPNGEGMIARLRRQATACRILVLATRSGPETVERVLHAGASGLVGKESALGTVVRALRSVAAGEVWANRLVTAQALEHLASASIRRVASNGAITGREGEIVEWVCRGLRNKEIAQRLQINEKTVKTHLNNIFRKLRIDSRIALALLGPTHVPPKT